MVTTFCRHKQVKMEASEALTALHHCNSPEPSAFVVRRYTNIPFIPSEASSHIYLDINDLPRGASSTQFPLGCLHLQKLLPFSKTEVLLPHEEGETGYRTYPLSWEILWKYSEEENCLSNLVSLSMPSSPPRRRHSDGARTQLESKLSKEAQKPDHKYDALQIKMERRHEQKQAWIAQDGDATFQEVFSMTSLADSVKSLPWCISSGILLCHMDDTLVAVTWECEPPQPLQLSPGWRNHLLQDS